MTARERLPNRRQCESLQFGADLQMIRAALMKDHDGGPATPLGAAVDKLAEGEQ